MLVFSSSSSCNWPGSTAVQFTTPRAQQIAAAVGQFDGIAVAGEPGVSQQTLVDRIREKIGDLRLGRDPEQLRRELGMKFVTLVEPRLGAAEARRLRDTLGRVDEIDDLTELTRRARA